MLVLLLGSLDHHRLHGAADHRPRPRRNRAPVLGDHRVPARDRRSTPLYGKLGDQYGRKLALQTALVLFLIGSALCGAAKSMTELIVFRGVQGLGGGGLIVSALAAIGDVVSPRERGRYQGSSAGCLA